MSDIVDAAELEAAIATQQAMLDGKELPFRYVCATDGYISMRAAQKGAYFGRKVSLGEVLIELVINNGWDPEDFLGSEVERGYVHLAFFLRENKRIIT